MIEIQLSKVHFVLGARTIFQNLNWEIQAGQRIGLIGPNGAGKSSLFKLIVGEYSFEPGGSITKAKGVSIGYLAQTPALNGDETSLDCAIAGNPRWSEVKRSIREIEDSFSSPAIYENSDKLAKSLERQQQLLDEYQSLGGDQYPDRVKYLLNGLGISDEQAGKPIHQLSGGQRKLVSLVRLLSVKPSVILLDEPDNHLDLKSKTFLEKTIREYPGAVVIISHDRYLLDAVTSHIAELEDGKLTIYEGDYSAYQLDKQSRLDRQEILFHVQQRMINRIEKAIKRYAIWAKVYDSEKFAKRARAIQNRLDKMSKIEKPLLERRRMDLILAGWRGSSKVLEIDQASKTYFGQTVLDPFDLTLHHGERVGVIGRNGSGKSVLVRMILGMETLDTGECNIGPSVKIGWYSQEHESLDPSLTILETIQKAKPMKENSAVAFLNRFLFGYQQISQNVSYLSGGERSRLQLALIMLSDANFLVLDEPTNNLDIASAEVLEDTLSEFEGTLLIVSHDRYFLDQVVERLIILEDGRVNRFAGNFSDWLGTTRILQ